MKSLWLLIKKNLKLLIRSKSSALIIFFAPLLIILILGLSYNTSAKYGLNIGVYSDSFTADVESFIESLQEQEFQIIKYEGSLQKCVDDIKLGVVHTCVNVPSNLKIEENQAKEITFYVDPSKVNLVWMIQETLQKKFNLKSQEISEDLASNILTKLIDAKTKVTQEKGKLASANDKSSSASSLTETAQKSLAALDLKWPTSNYDTNVTTIFKNNISTEIGKSKTDLAAALTALDESNLSSSEKSAIEDKIDDADDNLDKIVSLVNGTGVGSFDKVSDLIDSLQADLTVSTTKLSKASEAVSSASASLTSTTQSIKESISAIESVQVGLEGIKTNLESQKVTEAEVITSPLITKIERVGQANTYLNFMFPALLVLVIMFSSLLLGTTLVMMEKNSPAFFRNYFLPVQKATFIFATYLTNIIITLVQIFIILGVSLFFLKSSFLTMIPLALILLLSATVFTFLGMALGYIFKSEETGTLASISLGSFLLFLSGVILPLESVSQTLRKITFFNPFVLSEKIIREIFFFNSPFNAIIIDVLILVCYAFSLFLIILVLETVLQKHLVNHFMKHHHRKNRQKDKMKKNHA
ncbi:MAG: ABC transporter permease [Nanoarchaeota archaeon]|nr:ABC transporter permease [Nanoarchaeota archaeon]MBU1644245.1 ABC transporter permease [Nanoarchaeota archaeon]MBU1977235.1 ABC transporter permease [Nanoarchaeota archaeon]